MRRPASLLSLGALGLAGAPASAFDGELDALEPTVGVYLGWSFGETSSLIYGLDVSVFLTGQDLCGPAEDGYFSRLGLQLGAKGFSPELHAHFGGGYEVWGDLYSSSLGGLAAVSLHFDDTLSAEFSIGPNVQLGPTEWRATIGLIQEEARVQGGAISPRNLRRCEVVIGRPLRVAGKRAPLPAFVEQDGTRSTGVGWAKAAQEEWSSVAAFGCIQAQLRRHGAEGELMQRYEQAMVDETIHAIGAGLLAVQALKKPLHLGPPLTATPELDVDLAAIAVDAFWDGCIGEGNAALEAQEQASHAEGATQTYLSGVAAEEATHAELAWDTVEWVLGKGDAATRTLLFEALTISPEPTGTREVKARYAHVLGEAKARLRMML